MSFDNLKDQIAALEPSERRRLIGYAIALEDAENQSYRRLLSQRAEESDPGKWLTLEDFDKRLGLRDPKGG